MLYALNPLSLSAWGRAYGRQGLLPLGLVLVLASGKVFEERTSTEVLAGSLNAATYVRASLLSIALLILALRHRITWVRGWAVKAVGTYAFVAIASTVWSSAPIATLGKSVELCLGILILMQISSELSRRNSGFTEAGLADIVFLFIFVQLITIAVGYVFQLEGFHEPGVGGLIEFLGARAKAPFLSSNSVGYLSALLLAYLTLRRQSAFGRLQPLSVAFAASMLILSGSRTALAFTLLQMCLLLTRPLVACLLVGSFAAVAALVFPEALIRFLQGAAADENFYSLSGRTALWEVAYNWTRENAVLGAGYGVGSRTVFATVGPEGFSESISTAHNGFLEVLTGLGLLGFLPWLATILYLLQQWMKFLLRAERTSILVQLTPLFIGFTIMSVGYGGAFNEIAALAIAAILSRSQLSWRKSKVGAGNVQR